MTPFRLAISEPVGYNVRCETDLFRQVMFGEIQAKLVPRRRVLDPVRPRLGAFSQPPHPIRTFCDCVVFTADEARKFGTIYKQRSFADNGETRNWWAAELCWVCSGNGRPQIVCMQPERVQKYEDDEIRSRDQMEYVCRALGFDPDIIFLLWHEQIPDRVLRELCEITTTCLNRVLYYTAPPFRRPVESTHVFQIVREHYGDGRELRPHRVREFMRDKDQIWLDKLARAIRTAQQTSSLNPPY